MPLYEYECFLCHRRFERLQRVADEPVKKCPECGGAVRRLLGVPALQFKGSGFYITDYAKKGTTDAAAERGTSSSGDSAASSPSDTNTDAKSDAKSKNSEKKS